MSGKAADDDFLPACCFYLEPFSCSYSRGIIAVGSFCHDAFESGLLCGGKEFGSAGVKAFAVTDDTFGGDDRFEELATIGQGQACEVAAIEPEQVEHIVDQFAVGFTAPILQGVEIGLSFIVHDDYLSIEDGIDGPFAEDVVKRVIFFEGFIVTAAEFDLSFLQVGEGAVAIPFYFIGPACFVEGFVYECGEHGGDVFGDGGFAACVGWKG